MPDDLVTLVRNCVADVAEEQDVELPTDVGAETPLFGRSGLFDSVGLVSLVVLVEEAVEDATGVAVSLADQRALSQSRSPFRTVGSLAAYARERVEEGG